MAFGSAPKITRVLKSADAVRRFTVPTLNPNRTNEIFNIKTLKGNLKVAKEDQHISELSREEAKPKSKQNQEKIKRLKAKLSL